MTWRPGSPAARRRPATVRVPGRVTATARHRAQPIEVRTRAVRGPTAAEGVSPRRTGARTPAHHRRPGQQDEHGRAELQPAAPAPARSTVAERARRQQPGDARRPRPIRSGGITTPPPASSSTQTRFAPASTASARSVRPAAGRGRRTRRCPASRRQAGDGQPGQPRVASPAPAPTPPSTTDLHRLRPCSTARTRPASRPRRPSGVVPSSRSTPYRRSNPVAIAWPVNAVDISASASTPGATQVDPAAGQRQVGHVGDRASADQQQHRQHQGEQQLLAVARASSGRRKPAWASTRRGHAARRGRARTRPDPAPARRRSPQRPAGQVQEHVLQAAPAQGQVLRHDVARGAPGGHRGDHPRRPPGRADRPRPGSGPAGLGTAGPRGAAR